MLKTHVYQEHCGTYDIRMTGNVKSQRGRGVGEVELRQIREYELEEALGEKRRTC